MKFRLLLLLALTFSTTFAAEPSSVPADASARIAAAEKLAAGLTYHQGETIIGDGLAKITVPDRFRFLDAKDTGVVLSDLWGNPKGAKTLGALVPAGFDPLGGESWLVVITYQDDGYVKDDDAAKIDYAKMLAEMKQSTREANEQRVKEGYGSIELVGWAKPPRYDAATHKLYWAKELKFDGAKENTLNYNIRMLGRGGVLVLNAVASMHQLPDVEAAAPAILGMVNFQDGHSYADYKPGTDKTATYGLAALVAGGIAAKAGLFKGLWIAILAFKKVLIVALAALAGSIKKFLAWIRGRTVPTTPAPNPPPPAV
jgi:uncharacterized membrane-anchored protein